MSLLPSFLRRGTEPKFVAARPGLFDFVTAFRFERGGWRWLHLGWALLTLPIRMCWRSLASITSLFGSAMFGGFHGLQQRRIRHLVQGLPAFVAASAVVATAAVATHRHESLEDVYRSAAGTRFAAEDWEEARLYYERLFHLDGGSGETRLLLGMTLEKMGAVDEARRMIEGVATGDGGGNPRANQWVAAKLLADPKNLRDIEQLRDAHKHLLLAERGLPHDPSIKLELAKYYLAIGQPRLAVPKLAAAAEADPALLVDLGKLYAATGQTELASSALQRAEEHLRSQLEIRPEDRQARLRLASVLTNLGRANEAIVVLRNGLMFDPEGPYQKVIAKIYLAAYDRLVAQRPRDYRAMINTLREALRNDPQSAEVAERLVAFGEVGSPGQQSSNVSPDPEQERQARDMLQQLLVNGDQPATVHMALGLKAWRADDLETAGFHFARAYDLDDSLSGAANNLAWILTHQHRPDLTQALATIDPVIEQYPDVSHFRDTRGEIYLRLERWDDALADFERALPRMQDNPRLHESLATVYAKLGHGDIAALHRRTAEQLREKNPKFVNAPRNRTKPFIEPVQAPRPD